MSPPACRIRYVSKNLPFTHDTKDEDLIEMIRPLSLDYWQNYFLPITYRFLTEASSVMTEMVQN